MPEAAEEQLLETPGYMSDLEAAVAGNDETKLAEFYKQHFRSIGGSYFRNLSYYHISSYQMIGYMI